MCFGDDGKYSTQSDGVGKYPNTSKGWQEVCNFENSIIMVMRQNRGVGKDGKSESDVRIYASLDREVTNQDYTYWIEAEIQQAGDEIVWWRVGINLIDYWSTKKLFEGDTDIQPISYLTIEGGDYVDGVIEKKQASIAGTLQSTVSFWYFTLRNLALLVLMLILIYTGIRIVIGSTAGDKAKYKERLVDWLAAICLVMIMHYIMVFAVTFANKITNLVNMSTNTNINTLYIPLTKTQYTNTKAIDASVWDPYGGLSQVLVDNGEESSAIVWTTNLMGAFRLQAQLVGKGTQEWIGYTFCFAILVAFSIFFAFAYLKRIVYMAFLTMISPLVAMTYPIDKLTDGKAQAFNAWLKEYIFNLLIQPMHLLLYTVLVNSAYQLATDNPLYAIVALGFIAPAEKLVRKFFGFEKAQTPGLLGGAAGAALAMSGLKNILKPRSHNGKSNSSHAGNEKQPNENKIKKYSNKNKVDTQDAIYKSYSSDMSGFQDDVAQEEKVKPQEEEIPKTHLLESGKENTNREYFDSHAEGSNPSADDKGTVKTFKRNRYKS